MSCFDKILKRKYHFEIYADAKGEFRFRLVASNGRIVAEGGEGYKRYQKCERDIERIKEQIDTAEVFDLRTK